ncbi:MAG: hypothetical protein AAFY71_16010 [Bacteroidota bacterium]
MRYIPIFCLLIFCISCQKATPDNSDKGKEEVSTDSVAAKPEKESVLSLSVFTDSLDFKNPTLTGVISYPQIGLPSLDSIVEHEIQSMMRKYRAELKNMMDEDMLDEDISTSGLWVETEEIEFDGPVVSYRIYESTMMAGAAHPVHSYLEYNFSKKENRLLEFKDIFNLPTEEDSLSLIKLINQHFPDDYAELRGKYDYGFNLKGDSISFNFDSYEVGPYAIGMPRSVIAKSELGAFLHEDYQ